MEHSITRVRHELKRRLLTVQSADFLTPRMVRVVLGGVGHIPFEEMPEVCNRAMGEWLAELLPQEASGMVSHSKESSTGSLQTDAA